MHLKFELIAAAWGASTHKLLEFLSSISTFFTHFVSKALALTWGRLTQQQHQYNAPPLRAPITSSITWIVNGTYLGTNYNAFTRFSHTVFLEALNKCFERSEVFRISCIYRGTKRITLSFRPLTYNVLTLKP